MQRATLSARSSTTLSPPSSMAAPLSSRRVVSARQQRCPAAAPLSAFTTRAAVGMLVARQQRARRAVVKVSASASNRHSSTPVSFSSSSTASSAAVASLAAASQPLALSAVGVLGAASTVPFGSALFASIGGGGGWWKGGGGGGGGGGNGGDGNNNNNGGGGGNVNPSVSDLAAAAKDDDGDESGSEYEEVEGDEEEGAPANADGEEEEEEDEDEDEQKGRRRRRPRRGGAPASSSSSSDAPDAFFLAKLSTSGLPQGPGVPSEAEIFGEGDLTPGFSSSKSAVATEIKRLLATGMFASVNARATQVPGRPKGECELEFQFKEKEFPPLKSFKVVSPSAKNGAPAIPFDEVQKVMARVGGETGMRRLAVMREVVDGWYDRHGYAPQCRVARFDGLDSGEVVAVVEEPRVNRLRVVPVDDYWQPFSVPRAERERAAGMQESANDGVALPPSTVARELPYFKRGQPLNMGVDGRKAMRDVMAVGIYDNCQVQLKDVAPPAGSSSAGGGDGGDDDDDDDGAGEGGGSSSSSRRKAKQQQNLGPQLVDVEILVHERPHKTAEAELEWQFAPSGEGGKGRPALVSALPGGSLLFEDRNVMKRGISASASLSSASLLFPSPEELGFRVDVKVPQVFGADDPKRSAITLAAFNSRKLSPVFQASPGSGDEVPPVMLDRVGAKLSLTETYSRNSRGSLGVVVERVAAVDENGAPAPRGTKQLSTGALAPHGPPTTLSPTGADVLAYLQGSLVRDATWDCAGQTLGARDVAVVDQGVGIGSASPVFNRSTLSVTRHLALPASLFGIPLRLPEAVAPRPSLAGPRPPSSLVLHARGGAAVGALPSYEAFALGGPHSARGFNVGELGTARRFAEAAVELRVPVARATAFAFLEAATDLGSGAEVSGNPTAFYRRPGAGSSLGLGAKMGAARLEWATDSNAGRGTLFMRYGERF